MDYTIVTFGDFGLMVMALNGIAAITNHSSFMFIPLIGTMTGMFFLTARYLTSMKVDLHHLLTGVILFSAMFGPKVDVLVESATGQVQPVANVPIGLATPLSITTIMGRYFAEQFETVFSVASNSALLEHGYMDALSILIKVRDFDIRATDANSSESTGNKQDVHKTVQSYLTQCFLYDINSVNAEHTWDQVKNYSGANIWEAVKTEYVNIDGMNYLGTEGVPRNCALLWDDLNTAVFSNPSKTGDISKGVLKKLGNARIASMTFDERIGEALEAIRINSDQAQRYMYNSLMANWLNEADSLYSMKASDMGATIMKTQASAQNNLRWAAEQSQFERYAKPIISFIELFVVAATPIMAFVIVAFGTAGLSLAFKYLLMLVWVAFWAPTLTIANFFIHYKVVEYIEYLATQRQVPATNDVILNLGELPYLWTQLQDWVAVGGMMAAATPALTLMLIYGTSQTAVNLAGKLNQGERVDEKLMTPDIAKQAPLTSVTSNNVGNSESGIARTNAGIFDTGINLDRSASTSLKSAQSALQSSSETMQTQYGLNNSTTASATLGETFQKGITNSKDSALTSQYNQTLQKLQSIGKQHGLSDEESTAAAKQAIASFGVGQPLPPITASAQFQKSHNTQQAARASETYNEDVRTVLGDSELFSKSNSTRTAWQDSFNQSNSAQIQNARQESKSQSELFANMQSQSRLVSATTSLDGSEGAKNVSTLSQLAQKYEESDKLDGTSYMSQMRNKVEELKQQDPDFARRFEQNKKTFSKNFSNSPERNEAIASLKTLSMSKNPEASGFFFDNVGKLLNVPQYDSTQGYAAEAASQGMDTSRQGIIDSQAPQQGAISSQVGNKSFTDKTPSKQDLSNSPINNGADKGKIKQATGFSGQKMIHSGTHDSPTGSLNSSQAPGIKESGNSTGGITTPNNQSTSPASAGIVENPPASGISDSAPPATAKPSSSKGSSKPKQASSGGKSGDMSKPSASDDNSVTIGKPNEEHLDGTANILASAGSAVALAEARDAKAPIYKSGVTPALQGNKFAEDFRQAKRSSNDQAFVDGKENIGRNIKGYDANQTPSERLVQDGLEQDRKIGDWFEEKIPGGGREIWNNASMVMGGMGVGRSVITKGAKQIMKSMPKGASKKVQEAYAKKATESMVKRRGAVAAVSVAAEGPTRQGLEWYAQPDSPSKPTMPPQYMTPNQR
ncbi:MAG: conjugal transfer protein TraG N-terminal domain-containing protein [Methylophilus sp.]|uniref:conjugal transfer protein TraG N-terminal domain-containing protein n=1 Tax=Methylophilus sp. TaxID=29541 RepID=UPI003FA0E8D0